MTKNDKEIKTTNNNTVTNETNAGAVVGTVFKVIGITVGIVFIAFGWLLWNTVKFFIVAGM